MPDMVMTMIEVNDGLGAVVYEDTVKVKAKLFWEGFRVSKLVRLLQDHNLYKFNKRDIGRGKRR